MNHHEGSADIKGLHMMHYENMLWNQGVYYIAGIDEAGRGPLAGPVVAAAVIFPRDIDISGIRDSKKCSAGQRERLMKEIQTGALDIGVGVVEPDEIDRINILQATLKAMQQAVERLSLSPQHLLIDGNRLPDCCIAKTAIVRGDQICYSIAAASIVAKVTRDRMMADLHRQYPEYGFDRHKGYGTRDHIRTLSQYGYCPAHRRSFHLKGAQP